MKKLILVVLISLISACGNNEQAKLAEQQQALITPSGKPIPMIETGKAIDFAPNKHKAD